MDPSVAPWVPSVRALLTPVQFDRNPLDAIDRVFLQQFGPGTSAASARQCLEAVEAALASGQPLSELIPLSHTEAEVRTFLEAVQARLAQRFAVPASSVPPSQPDDDDLSPADELLELCEARLRDEISYVGFLAGVDEVEAYAADELSRTDEPHQRPHGSDVVLQGLGMVLNACTDARADEVDLEAVRALAVEAARLIATGRAHPDPFDESEA